MQAAARQQHAGAGQRNHLARPGPKQEARDDYQRHGQTFDRLPGVQRHTFVGRLAVARSDARLDSRRVHEPAARQGQHQYPGRHQTHPDRQHRLEKVTAERQMQSLADQHVLRVSNQRRSRTDVRAAGQRKQERPRVQATGAASVDQNRRHGQANDVVAEHGRQHGDHEKQRAD